MGSTATVLVTPHLQINGRPADVKLLQNIKASIRTEDFINNIPTTQTFENLKANSNSEISLSFQVPANLNSVQVSLTCSVMNTTSKSLVNF